VDPAQAIVGESGGRRGDLIVVGSREYGRLAGLLPDSIGQELASHLVVVRWRRPLDPLPQTGLLVEAIEFDAAEIETRDDSHHFAVIDDRHMAIASILHQP